MVWTCYVMRTFSGYDFSTIFHRILFTENMDLGPGAIPTHGQSPEALKRVLAQELPVGRKELVRVNALFMFLGDRFRISHTVYCRLELCAKVWHNTCNPKPNS